MCRRMSWDVSVLGQDTEEVDPVGSSLHLTSAVNMIS